LLYPQFVWDLTAKRKRSCNLFFWLVCPVWVYIDISPIQFFEKQKTFLKTTLVASFTVHRAARLGYWVTLRHCIVVPYTIINDKRALPVRWVRTLRARSAVNKLGDRKLRTLFSHKLTARLDALSYEPIGAAAGSQS
jgi:hypothetical protein